MTIMAAGSALDLELDALRREASAKLDVQAGRAGIYLAYFDGDEEIPAILDTEERQTFRQFMKQAQANWAELVVNAVAERLEVTGFDFGTDDATQAAWGLWQANGMDADAELAQLDALVTGSAPVLVQATDEGVEISAESPLEACVLYEHGSRRRRRAGYKRYTDPETAHVTEWLITPQAVAYWDGQDRTPWTVPNASGIVGLCEIIPQPRTGKGRWPRSELKPVLPIQDRINTTIFARMVATDFGAFRQIWTTGVKLARKQVGTDPQTGEPVVEPRPPFQVGANRLLMAEDPAARFGVIPESSLGGYLSAVEQDVNQLAAITQTPPHYLLGRIANLSADAITAAESGLVAKVRRRARHIGEGWEEVMRTALALDGHPEAAAFAQAEVTWRDFETRSLAQLTDALVKMATLGVPRRVLWERWGASPQELDRWAELADAEAEQSAAVAAQATALLRARGQGPPAPPGGTP
jgi:hypothetical protein